MKIGELFLALGFDVEEGQLKEFTERVTKLNATMIKSAGIAAGAVFGIQAFVQNTVTGARALNNFREQTGLAWQELQKWQVAGRLSDVALSAEEVQSSISGLQSMLADIRMGRGDASAFAMFGVDVMGKDAFQVLEDVRRMMDMNVARFGQTETVNLIRRMGLDPRFVTLLKMSSAEMENLRKEFTMTEKAQARLLELGGAVERFRLKLEFLKMEQIAAIAPELIEFFKNVTAATEFTIEGIAGLVRWFSKLKDESPLLALALAGVTAAAVAMLVPFGKFIVIPALMIAGFNDLGAYLRGEDSWIGFLIEKLHEVINLLEDAGTKTGKLLRTPLTFLEETGRDLGERMRDTRFGQFVRDTIPQRQGAFETGAPIFNNNYYIQGEAQPDAVAREILRQQQQQLNYGLSDANNGSLY